MRFLVVGLGSMGKRRIRNLLHLGEREIAGYDPRNDRRDETSSRYTVTTFSDVDEAFEDFRPDAVIVSTPPDLHVRYGQMSLARGRHFFAEASVVADGMDELIALSRSRPGLVAAPSCTMRYHPSVRRTKQAMEIREVGDPKVFTYHFGQWLPDWHPWEDYRTFYASQRDTGACREIVPFELSWLTWVFGPIERVAGMRGKLTRLETEIDDAYQVLLHFASGLLGHLLVDVIARAPVRSFRLCGDEGTVEWQATERTLRVYTSQRGSWETAEEPRRVQEPGYVYGEDMYIDEMRDFVAACRGERAWSYTLAEDKAVLDLLLSIERSSDTGTQIGV